MIASGYKWIRFEFRDRGEEAKFCCCCCLFCFFFFAFYRWRSATVRGPWGEEEEKEGRLRRRYPLDWHIKAEAHRDVGAAESIDGDRGRQGLLETSRSCRSRRWEGGKGLGDESKSLCLYFHPSLWVGSRKNSLVVWKKRSILICINTEALNVFKESTLAIIAARNLHYLSETEAFF